VIDAKPGRVLRRVLAAGFLAIIGLAAGAGSPAFAAPMPPGDCTATSGATLVVDFRPWGGPLLRACGSAPTTGFTLLNQGGWDTTGTEHDGPGFICRIGYAGFRHGTQFPTPAHEACVNTPPASAYWTYWDAGPGQDTWNYSQTGAVSYRPQAGSISLWIFGGTDVGGRTGSAVPTITPAGLRRLTKGIVAAPPVDPAPPGQRGSYLPALVTAAIVAVLAVTAVVVRRRRARAAS
jgi:hypothetical protein